MERCYYIGQRKEDRYNGEGTLYYKNGDKYEGGWKDGDYCGQGILYKSMEISIEVYGMIITMGKDKLTIRTERSIKLYCIILKSKV